MEWPSDLKLIWKDVIYTIFKPKFYRSYLAKALAPTLSEEGARAPLHVYGINNVLSIKFRISGLLDIWILPNMLKWANSVRIYFTWLEECCLFLCCSSFVDYETSLDFPSARRCEVNDWFFIFGWSVPLTCHKSCSLKSFPELMLLTPAEGHNCFPFDCHV